jgi:hypothetical protein
VPSMARPVSEGVPLGNTRALLDCIVCVCVSIFMYVFELKRGCLCAHDGVCAPTGKIMSPLYCLPSFVRASEEEEGAAEVLHQHF